jgi:hypothetical protein
VLLLPRNLLQLLSLLQPSQLPPQLRKLLKRKLLLINLWTRKRGDRLTESRFLVIFRIFRELRENKYQQH